MGTDSQPRTERAGPSSASTLALYVHWPFCRSKCPYCDFNSFASPEVDQRRWRRALLTELRFFADQTSDRLATSVFFGGGTPSLMAPDSVAAILEAARTHWRWTEEVEVTLEANPNSAEAGRFHAYREAGVNRISLGVQSFDDDVLTFLERSHDAAQARRAIEAACDAIPRVSFDLIYALPGQTMAAWSAQLKEAIAFAPGHLSAYQLTIEPGTPFHEQGVATAEEDNAADQYELTGEMFSAAGLLPYEISNHARPGQECRHNLSYWRGHDYVGLGPGAHGRLTTARGTDALAQTADPNTWLEAVERSGHGTSERSLLRPEERRDELIMMGLRTAEGVNRARFRRLTGLDIEDALDRDGLARLLGTGLVALDERGLRVPHDAWLRADFIHRVLLS